MGLKIYKKLGVCSALLLGAAFGVSAQTPLLSEGFEYAFPPQGWTVQNSTAAGAVNHWDRVTYSVPAGTGSAHVSSPNYEQAEPVKEEVLITPAVKLDGYYALNFIWKGATAQSIAKLPDNAEYDFQVRVRESGSSSWKTIFSFLDEEMVRNSGLSFPWNSWTNNPASINLTEWANKTVEFAFVYCLLKPGPSTGNDIWVDEVSIVPAQQITGPVAAVYPDSYVFPTTFIGGKKYSEAILLKNEGKDVLTVTAVNGLAGTDFGCTLVPGEVSLKTGDVHQFQFYYEPTAGGAARATATIATNGGNVTVNLSGTKKVLSDEAVYEGFEGEVFPPLGWTQNGSWYRFGYGLTGDASAVCSFPYAESHLTSPRLDLSAADDQAFEFTYFEQFDPVDDYADSPQNYFRVSFSKDGGKTWQQLFDSYDSLDEEGSYYELNTVNTVRLELPGGSGDNCYVRFSSLLPGFSMSDYDDVPEYSLVYVDDVILPALYGSAGAPASSTPVTPADQAKDVYNKNLTLEWTGALFATNYKLYLGKSATNFDVFNGIDMGTETSYTVARLDYNTTYYWKVVAYNGTVENTAAPTWSFTVMADQSVKELPYSENFDQGFPLGWKVTNEGYTRWSLSDYSPYGGSGLTPMASGSTIGTKAILETQEITLPATGEALVSFVWGNSAPVGLQTDASGQKVNTTKEPNNEGAIYFDIEVDGKWQQLGILSEKGEGLCWYRESFNLGKYAGKTVSFRWRYEVYSYAANSAAVDNFSIQSVVDGEVIAAFNTDAWNAGYVNNGESVTSRNPILLSNMGASAAKVRSAKFTSPNFTTTLAAGTEIAPNRSVSFAITYDAGTVEADVEDSLTVTFENGSVVSLPVSGKTLAADVFYYDFEKDQHASTKPIDFSVIDRDGYATVQPVLIYYPNRGAPYAYIVLNITGNYADWRNVYPVSGEQVLASMAESTGNYDTDDWIISPQMTATDRSRFRFFAKCYGDSDQQFSQNYVEVLVSTVGKEIANFETALKSQKIPWSGSEGKWTEYTVDLSKYAGQKVYIAVRHTADRNGFVSFFDDFWFEHFNDRENGIGCITTAPADAEEELYDLNGLKVDPATAAPGIYIRRSGSNAEKVVK